MSPLICSAVLVLLGGADVPAEVMRSIAAGYQGPVEQAFQSHCADCHGRLAEDIGAQARETAERKSKKAHKRLNMDDGFPFASKWNMRKLMTRIRKAAEKNDMPPPKYMRQKARQISAEERKAIADWARNAESLLKGQ